MRYGELLFVGLMAVYHLVLLVPRHRRPFAGNYLVFAAGMALAWDLGLEGLRWQTLPGALLLLIDLLVLFPTFKTLRGIFPRPGFWSGFRRFLRFLTASVAFLWAIGVAVLSVAFPLPKVELTGGLLTAERVVDVTATGDRPALRLLIWYPASGNKLPRSRPDSDPTSWQRTRLAGGPPAFWQSYLAHLPSSRVQGGALASAGVRYPVVYAAVPKGQNPDDFGYVFEDLASRGFVVAAAVPLPTPIPPPPTFTWNSAWTELALPLRNWTIWLEPDRAESRATQPDFRWIEPAAGVLKQLDNEPGDLLFGAVDGNHQGLWSWGQGATLPAAVKQNLGLKGLVYAGGPPPAGHQPSGLELWIAPDPTPPASPGQWFLTQPTLHRADVSDAAYLKPYLAFFGLKSSADAEDHGAMRQYLAAFYQFAFWGPQGDTGFGATVPAVPGLKLTGR
jgi:hypothetical protein